MSILFQTDASEINQSLFTKVNITLQDLAV